MIVIINGPLGIGKTQTSWMLAEHFQRAVMLDGDYIAAFQPFDYYNQEHLAYAHSTFRVLIAHHYAHGIQCFVINWVFETSQQLAQLKQELATLELPIHIFRLRCDPEVIAQRIRRRNLPNLEFELRRSRELVDILEKAAACGDLGIAIDTTHLTVDQVVAQICREIELASSFRFEYR